MRIWFQFEMTYARDSWLEPQSQYRWFLVVYQIGVFSSRSLGAFLKPRRTWWASILQVRIKSNSSLKTWWLTESNFFLECALILGVQCRLFHVCSDQFASIKRMDNFHICLWAWSRRRHLLRSYISSITQRATIKSAQIFTWNGNNRWIDWHRYRRIHSHAVSRYAVWKFFCESLIRYF